MLHANQATIRSFRVIPDVPKALAPLLEIAHNFWWSWHPEAVELFRSLDRELWESTGHNPVRVLGEVDQKTLDRVAQDRSYLHALGQVYARFTSHFERASWFQQEHGDTLTCPTEGPGAGKPIRIAYFSAEFGLAESTQIYSGGLGCLAGDHIKSASELGVPLCAVGLLYRCGYFHQYLNADGFQQERYPDLDPANQPMRRVTVGDSGEQLTIQVELPGRSVTVGVWRADVGRVPLYLLDTNMPQNSAADRDITKTLYGGDIEMRIQQEIVLGIGGTRALKALGEDPSVFHINEGHAAFISIERIARLRAEHGVDFDCAKHAVAGSQLFTTHTPVPAGIDRFSPDLVTRYMEPYLGALGTDMDNLLSLGRANPFDRNEFFSMAILALRCSQFANGVSKLHGEVSRDMWQHMWPGMPDHEIPIGHVTNGVHGRSWVSHELVEIFDRYIGPNWQLDPLDHDAWAAVNDIPDEELWAFRKRRKRSLMDWCRTRVRQQLTARGRVGNEADEIVSKLDPDVFTIGFARRFATYKRGTLLMRDMARLEKLLTDADRPIQILIAGKAHPADRPGKELIRELVKLGERSPNFRGVVFIEDYDIEVGRRLTQGCDIWLNTPKRGMEASGTSGMKAAMNGVLNCSILDGWWDEAYTPEVGFAIGQGESYHDQEFADDIESKALYDLLERVILPEYYNRDAAGLPREWITRVKACIRILSPQFSTNRMVADYTNQYYHRAHDLGIRLTAHGLAGAKELASAIHRFHEAWPSVQVRNVTTNAGEAVPVRSGVRVRAEVDLAGLDPTAVKVQMYTGQVASLGDLQNGEAVDMRFVETNEGISAFEGVFQPKGSGMRGFAVRVLPSNPNLVGTLLPGLVTWDNTPQVASAKPKPVAV